MVNSLRVRLGLLFLAFLLLVLAAVTVTYGVVASQRNDALRINLAGRQRCMLHAGHLLVILHEVPDPETPDKRSAQLYWRSPDGKWQASAGGAPGIAPLRAHVETFVAAANRLETMGDGADSADDWFALLPRLLDDSAVRECERSRKDLDRAAQGLCTHWTIAGLACRCGAEQYPYARCAQPNCLYEGGTERFDCPGDPVP